MKRIIGKTRIIRSFLPRKIHVNKIEILEENLIANEFNDYFTNVGISLARKILEYQKPSNSCLQKTTLT